MKRLLLFLMFVVTWKAYEAKHFDPNQWGENGGCQVVVAENKEEFDSKMKAIAKYTILRKERINFDVKIYEEHRRQVKP